MKEQRDMSRAIKILAKENPHRKASASYRFFATAQKSKDVESYLKKFRDEKDRRNAQLYLSISRRKGHVKIAA
jgi:hypothetical protein